MENDGALSEAMATAPLRELARLALVSARRGSLGVLLL